MTFFNSLQHKYTASKLILLFLVVIFGFSHKPAESAVELAYFRGSVSNNQFAVTITWKTEFEQRTAGYFIKRKIKGSPDEPVVITVVYNNQETQFVQAAEDGTTGAEYTVSDQNIIEGAEYEYSLWEQEFNNSSPSDPEDTFEIVASLEEESSQIVTPTPSSVEATATPVTPPTVDPNITIPATSTPVSSENPNETTSPNPAETTDPTTEAQATASATPAAIVETQVAPPTAVPITTSTETVALPAENEEATKDPNRDEPAPTVPGITPRPSEEEPGNNSGGVVEASELPQEDGTYPDPNQIGRAHV